jgi:prepilin-type N-terminal cleavage/methylation domain-containing protein/prepilin-type processing-associated H-X9-DG protein
MTFTRSPSRRPTTAGGEGFSLIEVLVVIAIIGLVVSMLLPALARARASERTVHCSTNLHQWGVALHLYTANANGLLPRRGQGVRPLTKIDRHDDWFNALPPMMRMQTFAKRIEQGQPPKQGEHSVWVCPEATDPGHTYFLAYAMNMMLSTWNQSRPMNIETVGPPERVVFLADGPGAYCSVVPTFEDYTPVARHANRVNLVFLDGHTTTYRGTEVGCGVGDPLRSDIRWIPHGSTWTEPGQPETGGAE